MAVSTTTALVAMAIGSAVSAVGQLQAGKQAEKQAKFQAAIYAQQAAQERQIAAANEEDFRRKQAREMAARRAMLGASGVEAGTGSPLLVSQDFAGEVELQALRIRQGGEVQATRLEQQAALTRMQGAAERTSSYFRAGSSLLQGFGTAAYYKNNPKLLEP